MEYLDENFQSEQQQGLTVTREMREDWHITARWAKFLSIVGFVFLGLGLMYLFALPTLMARLSMMGLDTAPLELMNTFGIWFVLLILGGLGIQFMVYWFQLRFANQMQSAIRLKDQDAFESSWLNFRNVFRWVGILIIAMVAIILVTSIAMYTMLSQVGFPQ